LSAQKPFDAEEAVDEQDDKEQVSNEDSEFERANSE